ncbi:MAG: hypothetical protein WC364_14620 [Eubacteriales bacterium]|jgi:hypothetical protein
MVKFGRKFRINTIGNVDTGSLAYQAAYSGKAASDSLAQMASAYLPNDKNVEIVLQSPLTMTFVVKRFVMPALATAKITVLNVGKARRDSLYRDPWQSMVSPMPPIKIAAGYGEGNLPYLFIGNVKSCCSYRRPGSTDYATEFECFGASDTVQAAVTSRNMRAGESKNNTILSLISELTKADSAITKGAIHSYDTTYSRGIPLFGETWELLKRETDNKCFIDNNTVHVLEEGDCFAGVVTEISAESGLKSTPIKHNHMVQVEMVFEPGLVLGQAIRLNSKSYSFFNGDYKIYGIEHSGTISDSQGGECSTLVTLYRPDLMTFLNAR